MGGAHFAGISERSATKRAFDVGNVGRRFVLNQMASPVSSSDSYMYKALCISYL